MVYILSDILQKTLRCFGLSTSDPFTLLSLSGLIRPQHAYHEPATPTGILNFVKCCKTRFDGNYLSQQPIRDICWYICLFISQVVIIPSFSRKDQTWDQLTVTPIVWTSKEYCKSGDKFFFPMVAFLFFPPPPSSSYKLFFLIFQFIYSYPPLLWLILFRP